MWDTAFFYDHMPPLYLGAPFGLVTLGSLFSHFYSMSFRHSGLFWNRLLAAKRMLTCGAWRPHLVAWVFHQGVFATGSVELCMGAFMVPKVRFSARHCALL